MIAQNCQLTFFDHDVQTLERVGAVADDVTQANDLVDIQITNPPHHCGEGFKVAMDVADDCPLHRIGAFVEITVFIVGLVLGEQITSFSSTDVGLRKFDCGLT